MALSIIKGKIGGSVRGIVYGTPGVGKSTLLSLTPNPLFIDIEGSTEELDIQRVKCPDWRSIEFAVKDLLKDPQGFKTVVFDTADWLEKALIEFMSAREGNKGIEQWDGGYGKGYLMLAAVFSKFLADCTKLTEQGVHVLFTAHSHIKKVSLPDQTESFDRYEMKLSKHVCPLLQEWATLILFYNHKVELVRGTDKKIKGGADERFIYTEKTAAYDAKNRFGLPAEIPAPSPEEAYSKIAHIFNREAAKPATAEVPTVASTVEQAPLTTPEMVEMSPKMADVVCDAIIANRHLVTAPPPAGVREAMITLEQLAKLELYAKNSVGSPLVEAALKLANAVGIDELTAQQAAITIKEIQDAMNAPDVPKRQKKSEPSVPKHIAEWLDEHAAIVEKYLTQVKWLQAGQTWRNLTMENLNYIIDSVDNFARAAKIPKLKGAA